MIEIQRQIEEDKELSRKEAEHLLREQQAKRDDIITKRDALLKHLNDLTMQKSHAAKTEKQHYINLISQGEKELEHANKILDDIETGIRTRAKYLDSFKSQTPEIPPFPFPYIATQKENKL
jgi:uncharacterized FlgJ-related protein